MPVLSHKTYSHKPNYAPGELALNARQKNEKRYMPAAYTPKSASMRIGLDDAQCEIEYSVKESGSSVDLIDGVKVSFGRSTKKVLQLSFEYPTLERLLEQMSNVAKVIKARQKEVPQDSIKRNYEFTAQLLLFIQSHVQKDLEKLRRGLSASDDDTTAI